MKYWINVDTDVNVMVEDINPKGKDTILFLHGWPLNHNIYDYQYDVIPYEDVRCLGMDTRGFGESSRPINGYDYDRLADDVLQVIETLGLEDITLCGHSMGGAIAVRYLSRHNLAHVKKLGLFGAAVPSLVRTDTFPFGGSPETIDLLFRDTYENRPQMLKTFGSLCFYQPVPESLLNWLSFLSFQATGYATLQGLRTLRYETLFDDLPKITIPTIIMHGVHDRIAPYSLAKYMNDRIENSLLVPFEASGHMLFYEEKTKFNDFFLEFVKH
ncbi:MAG: alpha/beta hydrolase [Clostridium sp.]|nr:alpha/beta hydrolase [Clostridium sp.]